METKLYGGPLGFRHCLFIALVFWSEPSRHRGRLIFKASRISQEALATCHQMIDAIPKTAISHLAHEYHRESELVEWHGKGC